MYHIISLHTLNLHNVLCQLYPNKAIPSSSHGGGDQSQDLDWPVTQAQPRSQGLTASVNLGHWRGREQEGTQAAGTCKHKTLGTKARWYLQRPFSGRWPLVSSAEKAIEVLCNKEQVAGSYNNATAWPILVAPTYPSASFSAVPLRLSFTGLWPGWDWSRSFMECSKSLGKLVAHSALFLQARATFSSEGVPPWSWAVSMQGDGVMQPHEAVLLSLMWFFSVLLLLLLFSCVTEVL